MRLLSFLIFAALLPAVSCGGSAQPKAPEQSLATVVDKFYQAAVAFEDQVSKEFADNLLDPAELHRCTGYAALQEASQKQLPDFPIGAEDHEHLAWFAMCLGRKAEKPAAWMVSLEQTPGDETQAIASIDLPPDEFWQPTFYVRLKRDGKEGWKIASWPPRDRHGIQPYSEGTPRLHLSSWTAGAVPEPVQANFQRQFGSAIPPDSPFAQVEWKGSTLYHSLAPATAESDPWQHLRLTVQDVFIPSSAVDAAGLPTEDLVILADPEVPASLLHGVLEALAQPKSRWALIWLGTPGGMVDHCFLLDQQLAWEPTAGDLILTAGGSEAEWTAALAGADPANPVGLRLDSAMPVSQVVADLERLKSRGFTRVFIALPAKQE